MSRIRVCLKLWVPVDSRNDSGMVEAVEGLLSSLPELGEASARSRISELLPDYEPAGSQGSERPGSVDLPVVQSRVSRAAEG